MEVSNIWTLVNILSWAFIGFMLSWMHTNLLELKRRNKLQQEWLEELLEEKEKRSQQKKVPNER